MLLVFVRSKPPHLQSERLPTSTDRLLTSFRVCVRPVVSKKACLWGEGKNASNIHLAAWPGALAVAERLWSAREVNDIALATPRLFAQMDRLRKRGIAVRPAPDWARSSL